MDVLVNNRIQNANCNISGLQTCITNTNSTLSTAGTNISGLQTCIQNTNTCVGSVLSCVQGANSCNSSILTCVQGANSNISGLQTCIQNKATGTLGAELIGQTNNNYIGCLCVSKPGKFQHYKIIGSMCCWTYYCSQMTFGFAGGCGGGCSANNAGSYCCNQWACGIVYNSKCNNGSYQWSCAGNITWAFGCSSGCYTACSGNCFTFEIDIFPDDICNQQLGFKWHMRNPMGANGGGQMCCFGVENAGYACNCCGADPSCLQYVCFTTPSASCTVGCGQWAIYGYNRLA